MDIELDNDGLPNIDAYVAWALEYEQAGNEEEALEAMLLELRAWREDNPELAEAVQAKRNEVAERMESIERGWKLFAWVWTRLS